MYVIFLGDNYYCISIGIYVCVGAEIDLQYILNIKVKRFLFTIKKNSVKKLIICQFGPVL